MAAPHRNLHRRSIPPRRAVSGWLAGVAVAALLSAGSAFAFDPLVKTYNLGFGGKATLTSTAECGMFGCTITNSVLSDPIDRFVQLTWKNAKGIPLLSVTNAYFSNFFSPGTFAGYLDASESQSQVTLAFTIQSTIGIADFTGTQPLQTTPCSLANGDGYICAGASDGPRHYYFPEGRLDPSTGGSPPAPGAGTEIGRITTRLSNIGIDPATMTVQDDRRFTFLELVSTVSIDNGMYLYAHEVTNHTELDIPIVWTEAGIDETVGRLSTKRVELLSPLAPATRESMVAYHLENEEFGFVFTDDQEAGAMIFAPVPEPATVATLGAGLAFLLWQRRRRAPAH